MYKFTNDKSDDPVLPPLGHDPGYEHSGTSHMMR